MRTGAGPGYWCSLLIPVNLLIGSVLNNGSCIYTEISVLGFGLLIQSLCWKYVGWEKKEHFNPTLNINFLVVSLLVALILWKIASHSFLLCCILSFCVTCFFSWFLLTLLSYCSSSFTVGEAIVVTQGVTLFLCSCILSTATVVFNSLYSCDLFIPESTRFMQVLLLGCFMLIFVLFEVQVTHSAGPFFLTCLIIGGLAYASWILLLEKDPVIWLLSFSFWNWKRIFLIAFWFLFSCASILFVSQQSHHLQHASTITRKYFHIIIVLIYLPGVLWDLELLYVASGIALTIFIFLEIIRVLKIPPIGQIIDDAFKVFLDEKDSGTLVLTHIYLLVGCSCPLWLYSKQSTNNDFHVCLLSGVISVGIGDTAASVGGSMWGRHAWPGSVKTFEGTVCAITAQLIFILPLLWIGHDYNTSNLLVACLAVVFTSLLEAKTSQVDNLVLPLFQFCLLSMVE